MMILLLLLGGAVFASAASKVEVLLLSEAGCPFCQESIIGPINDMVSLCAPIVTVTQVPFGNNYYATEACGGEPYDADTRHCWASKCVGSSSGDCFSGPIVAQHGADEARVNRMEACAKNSTDDWMVYWKFLVCMEANYDLATNATLRCALDADLDPRTLYECYESPRGDEVQAREANATFDHDSVPWLLVNGTVVEDTDNVIAAVIAAYDGGEDVPEKCKAALYPSPERGETSLLRW